MARSTKSNGEISRGERVREVLRDNPEQSFGRIENDDLPHIDQTPLLDHEPAAAPSLRRIGATDLVLLSERNLDGEIGMTQQGGERNQLGAYICRDAALR